VTSSPRGQYTTKPLNRETWADFATLVEANNGVWGGCWCIGFHPEGLTRDSTAAGNRETKRAHVDKGTVHQILVYLGSACVGWIQYGPPAEVATIKNPKAYEKDLVDMPNWRIGCVFTDSKHRRHGVARAGLAAALDAISEAGGGIVEAYPEQLEGRGPQRGAYLHTGPESLFEEFGFARDRRIAKWRWVMRVTVATRHGYKGAVSSAER
jgi:GNAT superfamily N-acetyltransferase